MLWFYPTPPSLISMVELLTSVVCANITITWKEKNPVCKCALMFTLNMA